MFILLLVYFSSMLRTFFLLADPPAYIWMHVVFGISLPSALLVSNFFKPFFPFNSLLLGCEFFTILFVLQLTLPLFVYFKMAAEKIIRREEETDDLLLFNGKKMIHGFALLRTSLLWVNQIWRFCLYGEERWLWPSSAGDASIMDDIFL